MITNRRKFISTAALAGSMAAILPSSSCISKHEVVGYPDYIKTHKVLYG
jgi:hypothetical protein